MFTLYNYLALVNVEYHQYHENRISSIKFILNGHVQNIYIFTNNVLYI